MPLPPAVLAGVGIVVHFVRHAGQRARVHVRELAPEDVKAVAAAAHPVVQGHAPGLAQAVAADVRIRALAAEADAPTLVSGDVPIRVRDVVEHALIAAPGRVPVVVMAVPEAAPDHVPIPVPGHALEDAPPVPAPVIPCVTTDAVRPL